MYRWMVVFSVVVVVAVSDFTDFRKCDNEDPLGSPERCNVTHVRLLPCGVTKKLLPCRLRQEDEAFLVFYYIPDFTARKMKYKVANLSATGEETVPWLTMLDHTCATTNCPATPGQTEHIQYNFSVGKEAPEGEVDLKWTLVDTANSTNVCCFRITIQINK